MNNTPLSPQFGPRLQNLDREIQHSLSEVRRHIQALEQAERNAAGKPPFADLLKAWEALAPSDKIERFLLTPVFNIV